MSACAAMRKATLELHAELDSVGFIQHLLTTPSLHAYQTFLLLTSRAFVPIAKWLKAHCPDAELLRAMDLDRRMASLARDLRSLQGEHEQAPDQVLAHIPPDEVFGVAWVVEGSRLGGVHIARRLQSVLPVAAADGCEYLSGPAVEAERGSWTDFCNTIDRKVDSPELMDSCVRGAVAAFQHYLKVFNE